MRDTVVRDKDWSSMDLYQSLNVLKEHCKEFGPGGLWLMQKDNDSIERDLDILSGIDVLQRWRNCLRGVACRTQRIRPGMVSFRSFTIRIDRPSGVETEFLKRLWALQNKECGPITPYWTMHAYCLEPENKVVSIGLAKTEELYKYIQFREATGRLFPRKSPSNGEETFLFVDWDIYTKENETNYFYEWPEATP